MRDCPVPPYLFMSLQTSHKRDEETKEVKHILTRVCTCIHTETHSPCESTASITLAIQLQWPTRCHKLTSQLNNLEASNVTTIYQIIIKKAGRQVIRKESRIKQQGLTGGIRVRLPCLEQTRVKQQGVGCFCVVFSIYVKVSQFVQVPEYTQVQAKTSGHRFRSCVYTVPLDASVGQLGDL